MRSAAQRTNLRKEADQVIKALWLMSRTKQLQACKFSKIATDGIFLHHDSRVTTNSQSRCHFRGKKFDLVSPKTSRKPKNESLRPAGTSEYVVMWT
jgi:hypothetical protein